MANLVPTYIPAPNWDIPADSDLVVLGRLIKDPRDPESKIEGSSHIPIPPRKTYEGTKVDWATTVEQLRSNTIGMWAKCLQFVGGGVGLSQLKATLDDHRFDALETTYFRPDADYFNAVLHDAGVQAYLEVHKWRKSFYMITGIKVARIARASTQRTVERGVLTELKADATSVGIPLEAGPELSTTKSDIKGTSFSSSSDYVFAYRLLRLKPHKADASLELRAFVKGACYGKDEESSNDNLLRSFAIEEERAGGFLDPIDIATDPVRLQETLA